MEPDTLRNYLEHADLAAQWLGRWNLADPNHGHANLVSIAQSGITLDLLATICEQLAECLPPCADPDMALNNLDRFFAAARSPLALGTLFERDPQALPTLVQIFSASQYLSELLIADPESFDLLRLTEGKPSARQAMVDELAAEVDALEHDDAVLRALRRFKQREMLRIAYGDIVLQQRLLTVTGQISYLADAIVEAAFRAAWGKLVAQRGEPRCADGRPARFVILGMGKLGGVELNYSSDIDLIFFYEDEGNTSGPRPISNRDFFERLARQIVRLLTESTESGAAYRVDLRLRPEGSRGPIAISVPAALHYYDTRGRTWERQAYIKARPVAGHLELGYLLLDRLAPWIYRRYLSRADISGIRALKRRIAQRTEQAGGQESNVKTGEGGIRDVEFVIQFLQLLNGADLPAVRVGNTLEAIAQLASAGCLTNQERLLLTENYSFLRRIEHRLQIMFDLQTHSLPDEEKELRKLALRTGYTDDPPGTALRRFRRDYRRCRRENHRILRHLLQDAFTDEEETAAEVDLVLDPDPPQDHIDRVLGKYRFRDTSQAYRNLMALAEEGIPFLSTRRCRHFLASIAPKLLEAIAATPDPDSTLVNLGRVSDSLGGKGVLWELFSFNRPSLRLYVDLCAYSPYLCDILTSNPGMIDSLMDSLVLDKLPTAEWLRDTLAELCRAAEDLDPILHSFKNDQQLRVGVRDLLGKEDILATTGALSDIAQTCLEQIAVHEYHRLQAKFGEPILQSGPRAGEPAEMAILALGKFGGRELNYHSDLDVVFLYDGEGHTVCRSFWGRCESTTNQHFFSELAQRIIRTASRLTAYGRLYEVDARLRPTGKSGSLAVSLDEFARYFREGDGQLWERQALCRARVLIASPRMAEATARAVADAAFGHRWRKENAREIAHMRRRLEQAGKDDHLKRGPGGIVDIEFLVQMLQLKHGPHDPAIHQPNTLRALNALYQGGYLAEADHTLFAEGYRFLRTLESRLRLVNATARDKLPADPTELAKIAHLMGFADPQVLLRHFEQCTGQIRRRFDQLIAQEGG